MYPRAALSASPLSLSGYASQLTRLWSSSRTVEKFSVDLKLLNLSFAHSSLFCFSSFHLAKPPLLKCTKGRNASIDRCKAPKVGQALKSFQATYASVRWWFSAKSGVPREAYTCAAHIGISSLRRPTRP